MMEANTNTSLNMILATGNKEKLYSPKWDVMYMYTSLNEKYRVIGVNEDGKNKLYVFDHKTGDPIDFPKIEDGDVQASVFPVLKTKCV